MVPDHFYRHIKTEELIPSQNYIFSVILNSDHPLYKGHFPQQPIVPGVLMVALVKDLLENILAQKLLLVNARNIKYINMLIPDGEMIITINTQIDQSNSESVRVSGSISHLDKVFCKYKLEFV